MKKPIYLKIFVIAFFISIAVWAGYYFVLLPKLNPSNGVAVTDPLFGWKFPVAKFPSTGSVGGPVAYSDIRDPGGIPQGLPVRLKIPIIGVDSTIEDALITPDGRMDVPAGIADVAWFALGPHPGEVGSAVIGGHYGIQNGVPFVFYDLNKLKVGDMLYIIDDKNNTLTFVVRSIKSFDRNADATNVFTSTDGLAHLNLITCEGIWNEVNGNYPQRLVIFSDLVPGNNPISSTTSIVSPTGNKSKTSAAFSRTFGVGAIGADVVELQTILEQRGLLELPVGVTNGFFGSLTSIALAKYQTSVGLPPVGVFGPLTEAKINSELAANNIVLPNTGENAVISIGVQNLSISISSWVQFVGSAFATPLDGLITLLLCMAIIFVIFKIVLP
jgi:LPXTG-site transpeptidase (sortase) family protein